MAFSVLFSLSLCLSASGLQLGRHAGRLVESAADSLLETKMQVRQLDASKNDVEALSENVKAGGDKARCANSSQGLMRLDAFCLRHVCVGQACGCAKEVTHSSY